MSVQPAVAPERYERSFFVPEVRIKELGELTRGAEAGTVIEDLQPDVVKVEVTRVNTGAGQYSITLNNWYDTLPRDRKNADHAAGRRESLVTEPPRWPRFKYNDFQLLRFGKRLRIDMRYWPPDTGLSIERKADDSGWVPMISGPITDMKFTFSAGEGARLTVAGEEDMTPLKAMNKRKVHYAGKSEEDIVRDVLERAGYPLELAPPARPWPAFAPLRDRATGGRRPSGAGLRA